MKFVVCILVVSALAFTSAERCESFCTREFRPVCGTDGEHFKRFNNLCMMRNEHCKDGRNWYQTRMESCLANNDEEVAEEDQPPKNCPLFCPAIYAPVCGFDGQVYKRFGNKCVLETNNCEYSKNWMIVSLHKCA